MSRPFEANDFATVHRIINEAAEAYRDVIPEDRWHEPYMTEAELQQEIAAGVAFSVWEENGTLAGAMGIQPVQDVHLIRHAYVAPAFQRRGIGDRLLEYLIEKTPGRILVGTWAAAVWAIRFYEKNGFKLVGDVEEKNKLLDTYWTIPERQRDTSVVLDYQGAKHA